MHNYIQWQKHSSQALVFSGAFCSGPKHGNVGKPSCTSTSRASACITSAHIPQARACHRANVMSRSRRVHFACRGHTESHGGRGRIVRMIMHSTHHQKFKGDHLRAVGAVHASYYSAAAWFICSSCYVYLWIDSRSVSMPLRLNKEISPVCWRKEAEKEQWQKSEWFLNFCWEFACHF